MAGGPLRRRAASTAAGVCVLLLVTGIALVIDRGAPGRAAAWVAVARCRGFAPVGLELTDRALLGRALASWVAEVEAPRFEASKPAETPPPLGSVCAVNARTEGGRRWVTMLEGSRYATYVEPVAPGPGTPEIVDSGDLPDPTPLTLAALPVGDGHWQLAEGVDRATVWVGSPGAPPTRTEVTDADAVVDVEHLVVTYAAAHPRTLPHLLLLAEVGDAVYAATGGAPYAASLDSVFTVALAGGPQALDRYRTLLGSPSGVALLAQAIGFTPAGRQEPQRVDRLLTVVGTAETAPVGPVLVVSAEADDGSHLQPVVVSVVQRSGPGADVQPLGAVLSTGGWSGGTWLAPVDAGDPDPRLYLAVGRGALASDPPPELFLTDGQPVGRVSGVLAYGGVSRMGPVALVPATAISRTAGPARPHLALTATMPDGRTLLGLGPLP